MIITVSQERAWVTIGFFNCDMTLYYLRWQVDFHCSPGEMADKNIRTDYSKLKMLARIDRDSVQE